MTSGVTDSTDGERAAMRLSGNHRSLLERCEAMLTEIQWGYEDRCVVCALDEDSEHAPDCPLAALLSDLRKELGK